ncbi:MAG: hypothetical protein WA052_03600 [Microgenomates group bacterium]
MKNIISRLIHILPKSIGVGVGLGIIGIQVPMLILSILAPEYENWDGLLPRWIVVCVVISFVYFFNHRNKYDK